MKNTKRSITFKVIVGYILLAALAGVAVWFIYSQVVRFSKLNQSNNLNNQQLVLVSEIATELYQTENIGKQFIQSGDTIDLNRYKAQIGNIQNSIQTLRNTYADSLMKVEMDSISVLLSKKSNNLEELLKLRSKNQNTSYYKEVINELQKVDPSFNEPDYETRFANLEPHQRRVLIRLLEFSKKENNEQSSNLSADSLVSSVKKVLSELEQQSNAFKEVINKKENELLTNDVTLNQQLRSLLSAIEQEERATSLSKVKTSQRMLNEISTIIIAVGIAFILLILFFLVLILKDVSRSQRYRLELEDAKSFTESLMKRREQFMATITHDLRSPLNTVIGYTDLMEKSGLSTKQEHYLSHLKKSSEYILHLVNDLLDLSKLEAGKMLVENIKFNPKNLLEETFHNTLPAPEVKNLKYTIHTSENSDCQVLSDPFRLKQILSNLLTNAYKFTDSGEIAASLTLKKEIEDSYILIISIKDTGIGISTAKQEAIWEEFSQENASIEKKYGGTGLGLAITKQITALLKGSIQLISESGEGSEFIIKIPVTRFKEQSTEVSLEKIEELDLSGKNILVVDDEASQLTLSQELIKAKGMHCDTASNGVEALNILKKRKYHLVLTDIQMPKMDGFELVRAIKADPKIANIPVIAASGRTDVAQEKYTEAGFSSNILKPYRPNDLLLKIGQILKIELQNELQILTEDSNTNQLYSLSEISQFAGEDPIALNTIINAFIDSTTLNLEEILTEAENDNWERVAQISHRMLPMFKQLHATEIILKLTDLESKKAAVLEVSFVKRTLLDIEILLKELQKELSIV